MMAGFFDKLVSLAWVRYSILGFIGGVSMIFIHKMIIIIACNWKAEENSLFRRLTSTISFKDIVLWEIGSFNPVHALFTCIIF